MSGPIASQASAEELNVSLEPHLIQTLQPLLSILPDELRTRLQDVIPHGDPQPPTVPYSLLSSISAWTRTPSGQGALASHDPPLSPTDYSMVALLAGTRTSPDRKFPVYVAPSSDADERMSYSDRRAITNVLNALLSVGGAGVATWWAAGRLAWKDQWKVLLSLAVALIVAASEAILYLIWDARRSQRPQRRRRPQRPKAAHSKKGEPGSSVSINETESGSHPGMSTSTALPGDRVAGTLRERAAAGRDS